MELEKYRNLPKKRDSNDPDGNKRPIKKATISRVLIETDDENVSLKVYNFRVLLPNGFCLGIKIKKAENTEMPMKEFLEIVRDKYNIARESEHLKQKPKRRVNWNSEKLQFVDVNDHIINRIISLKRFKANVDHFLRLHDGSEEADTYENMWDLTPDTELLTELPAEYTFETALADLIDNSLQAVWSNGSRERRLISVELTKEKILIFDSGPGMSGSGENSIVRWGKMGASLNRSSRVDGVGGKPPYLTPVFGMFGYGGSIASMHLGGRALVSSKTKESKKVYYLHLQREALMSSSGKTWRTSGGFRNPTDDEISKTPHGSFTKVEIFEPRLKSFETVKRIQNRLKDIYFPYIQCDELSKTKTITPVEYEVNGRNLAEIEGGEVAITNLASCNGPDFVLQLHFSQDSSSGQGSRASRKANARLKFVYFPIVEGKESIEMILEKLKREGYRITENFESFSRVSIRRLGRLLPDARWNFLPFMKPKQQRGEKAHIMKRCSARIKCFIDTDAGFNPTPWKTDLANHHVFTTALKSFGDKPLEKEKDVNVDISRNGKQVTRSQLEKQYQEWIFLMHDKYDREVERGEDQPLVVFTPSPSKEKKKLGISSDLLRVHKEIPRKGLSWKSGQKIKLLKGAGAGVRKSNVHATLEYILVEGFEGDAGGETRLICRPLAVPEEKGCKLTFTDDGKASIDIGDSLSLPVNIIDHSQCVAVDAADWEKQVERQCQKQPSTVELLSGNDCLELGIDGALPSEATIYAGQTPPKEIVAVVRPASYYSASSSKNLDQKYIVKDDLEIVFQLKYNDNFKNTTDDHIYSRSMKPSSREGFHGLYVFPLGCNFPDIFKKAGVYTFILSLRGSSFGSFERKIKVKALSQVSSWGLLTDGKSPPFTARVGSCFPPISIACYDDYENQIPFPSIPEINIEVISGNMLLAVINKTKLELSSANLSLTLKDTLVESHKLDCIRPSYICTLIISSKHRDYSISIPCQVHPGGFHGLKILPIDLDNKVIPGHIIDELTLEMFDGYDNHVQEGSEVLLNLDGFRLLDNSGPIRKVDESGIIDLGGLLKVTGGYGSKVSLSVSLNEEIIKKNFQIEERELRIASTVEEDYMAGSLLENIIFVIVNPEGDVDELFNDDEKCGESHTLKIESDSFNLDDSVRYSFQNGCCTVRSISLPQNEGKICFLAAHSRHPNLSVNFQINVVQAPNMELEISPLQYSYEQTLLLQDSPAYETPNLENKNNCTQFSSGSLLLLQDSPTLKHVQDLVLSNFTDEKELMDECLNYGKFVGSREEALEKLNLQRESLEQDIFMLQDTLGPVSFDDYGHVHGKEQILELIEKKKDSAASVICKILRGDISEKSQKYFSGNILGVVALLGTVQSYGLSRILAEYLGEDHMLGVVCKSYSAVENLEQYDKNGNVDNSYGLHAVAAEFKLSISGRFSVVSLDDTSPYLGKISNDPERKLGLPDPRLPSGVTPTGYLGYAVNMIKIDSDYSIIKTEAGRGLHETLFYRLFGELQVYETRANMNMARDCIKYGAVSLDGGIMRDGIIFLGNRQSKICFPVRSSETHLSPDVIKIRKQIDKKKSELRETLSEIKNITKYLKKAKKKFGHSRDSYKKFLDEKGELLNILNQKLNGGKEGDI